MTTGPGYEIAESYKKEQFFRTTAGSKKTGLETSPNTNKDSAKGGTNSSATPSVVAPGTSKQSRGAQRS